MQTDDHEYLTFKLGDEEFGVDILCVQEIMVLKPTTPIPGVPDYLKGVINLRGTIVPIVDLRVRLGMQVRAYDATTVVIVLSIERQGTKVFLGIVVDAVSEVYKLGSGSVKPAPEFGDGIDSRFIEALGIVDDKLIMLLNTARLMDVKELYKILEKTVAVDAPGRE